MEQGLIEFGESRKANEVQIFNNPQFGQIRTAGTAENPLFCLAWGPATAEWYRVLTL